MLNYAALAILIFVVVVLFYGILVIHDIPHHIAKHRKHPHEDAIGVAGWVSLLTLHILWPFLWIWATLYRPDRGWGFRAGASTEGAGPLDQRLEEIARRLDALEGNRSEGS
jgi:hypothetical protein